jgi:hypothetical protein
MLPPKIHNHMFYRHKFGKVLSLIFYFSVVWVYFVTKAKPFSYFYPAQPTYFKKRIFLFSEEPFFDDLSL